MAGVIDVRGIVEGRCQKGVRSSSTQQRDPVIGKCRRRRRFYWCTRSIPCDILSVMRAEGSEEGMREFNSRIRLCNKCGGDLKVGE